MANKCPNGHAANSSGECTTSGCPYENKPSRREDGNPR